MLRVLLRRADAPKVGYGWKADSKLPPLPFAVHEFRLSAFRRNFTARFSAAHSTNRTALQDQRGHQSVNTTSRPLRRASAARLFMFCSASCRPKKRTHCADELLTLV